MKRILFKLIISVFVYDYKRILSLHQTVRTSQEQLLQYRQFVTLNDLCERRLMHLSERMNELQKIILHLHQQGLNGKDISRTLNTPLFKINKIIRQLNRIEIELLEIAQLIDRKD